MTYYETRRTETSEREMRRLTNEKNRQLTNGFVPKHLLQVPQVSRLAMHKQKRKMTLAEYNGVVIAESEHCKTVDGNSYFPEESLKSEYFTKTTSLMTSCPWKGKAQYKSILVDGKTAKNAAWFYATPLPTAIQIKGYVAFDKSHVKVSSGSSTRKEQKMDGGMMKGGWGIKKWFHRAKMMV
jgi:uncharacterized protein (DUF427 family)